MKRWNGWGNSEIAYPLPPGAEKFLAQTIGQARSIPDAAYDDMVQSVPPSRLVSDQWPSSCGRLSIQPADRLAHACGQSLPDWLALRSGQIRCFPDGIAYPDSAEEVRQILQFARQNGIRLIPYGGGTSVVGHINPLQGSSLVLSVDLSQLNKLVCLDETNRLATVGTGINGPALEAALNPLGYTLGHFPQSFEQSTLGGWIATRSTGQQSFYYGRIEDLFAGGHVETPGGVLKLPCFPASAAGPDLRQVFLGSEGRLGIITTATVRIRKRPEVEFFNGIFFHSWEDGAAAIREIAQEKTNVSMLRLSDADETETTLILSGKDRLVGYAERGLEILSYDHQRSLLVIGFTGDRRGVHYARQRAFEIARSHGGLLTRVFTSAGAMIGEMWQKSRFLTPYLRNTLWDYGYALDTLETAMSWSEVIEAAREIKQHIHSGLEPAGEKVLVFAHLSHVYRDGASLYVTFLFRRNPDPQINLQNWQTLKESACKAIVRHGGTISHQHGVGIDHAAYLPAEKGAAGMAMLQAMMTCLDPSQMMNPGKLVPDETSYPGKNSA